MDLERLVAAVGAVDVVGRAPVEVRDLAYDTRAVVPGALYFCVPGANVDGHDFADEAIDRGAVALVVERSLEVSVPQVVVPDARLDSLFLALPVAWKGTIQQYAGRLHRLHERKRAVTIFDYVDVHVPMLARMHQKRLRGYAAIGYLVAPGNATPTLRSYREM
jgi:UDP-N-acetylmuramyl pentapeptide synthase